MRWRSGGSISHPSDNEKIIPATIRTRKNTALRGRSGARGLSVSSLLEKQALRRDEYRR
jgi:hypothetical protein